MSCFMELSARASNYQTLICRMVFDYPASAMNLVSTTFSVRSVRSFWQPAHQGGDKNPNATVSIENSCPFHDSSSPQTCTYRRSSRMTKSYWLSRFPSIWRICLSHCDLPRSSFDKRDVVEPVHLDLRFDVHGTRSARWLSWRLGAYLRASSDSVLQ